MIAVGALVGMYLLLPAFFGSWRLATLSILTLPLGCVGALTAVVVTGGRLSLGSYIALFAAFALALRCGMLLFARFHKLAEEGEEIGPGLVLRGASDRLPAVASTTFAGVLVLLPLLVMGTRPGFELVHPVAVVLLGALVTSVPYALFVLP